MRNVTDRLLATPLHQRRIRSLRQIGGQWIPVVVAVFVLLTLVLVGFFAMKGLTGDETDQVKTCIQMGGDPKYTQNKYGNVVEYLGCVYDGS